MKTKVELGENEAVLMIDIDGKMGIKLPELSPGEEGVTVPTYIQLVAGMYLAMQRQNEKVVNDFLNFAMEVFHDEVPNDPADGASDGVRSPKSEGRSAVDGDA